MIEENSASTDFEAMLTRAGLVLEHKTTRSEYKLARERIAQIVIAGKEPTQEDLFSYLATWARYMSAVNRLGKSDSSEYDELEKDCQLQLLSPLAESHLRERIKVTKRRAVFVEALDTTISQWAFLGRPINENPAISESQDALMEIAAEKAWISDELYGLSVCLHFFLLANDPVESFKIT